VKQARKARQRLAFLPVSKTRTNKLHVQVNLVYMSNSAISKFWLSQIYFVVPNKSVHFNRFDSFFLEIPYVKISVVSK